MMTTTTTPLLSLLLATPAAAFTLAPPGRTADAAAWSGRSHARAAVALARPPKWSPSPYVVESEIKHGRLAMLSLATFGAMSAAGVDDPVRFLSQQSAVDQAAFFAVATVVESVCSLPRLAAFGVLRDDVSPGSFVKDAARQPHELACLVEDAAGRLAMTVAFGALCDALPVA
jgi:hypothetical protein